MKANELRIGNFVSYHNRQERVIAIPQIADENELRLLVGDEHSSTSDSVSKFNPIPITEEWLLKFGFEKQPIKDIGIHFRLQMKKNNKYFEISYYGFADGENDGFYFNDFNDGSSPFGIYIKSVHQLQNLYFALTGEELTIK